MKISNPVTRHLVDEFTMGICAVTHFYHVATTDERSVTCFNVLQCDHCGRDLEGANPITFTNLGLNWDEAIALGPFIAAGLKKSNRLEEASINNDGDCVCSACYSNSVLN